MRFTRTPTLDKVKGRLKSYGDWLKKSIWIYPIAVILALFSLAALQVHGSSIGVYHEFLYGKEASDPDLLYGEPKQIRSDEWMGWTPILILQSKTGFPIHNEMLGSGRDVSKHPEFPVNDWVNIFRPNNWSFFAMPLENAYAFKWWFLLALLLISCYFFVLRILPGRKLVAILISISFALSPFILWWYQSALYMPLAYGFLIILLGMRIVDQEKLLNIKSKYLTNALYGVGLAYLGSSTALTLYPPYFLPIMLAAATFLFGYILNKLQQKNITIRQVLKRVLVFLSALALCAIIGLAFVFQHKEMLEATSGTLYPGQRVVAPGDLPTFVLFDGFLMPLLQDSDRAKGFWENQSEASNFILLLPFLLLPSMAVIALEFIRKRRIDWTFLSVNVVGLIYIAKATIPYDNLLYDVLLLDKVPNVRLLAGIGFVGILQLILLIKKLGDLRVSKQLLDILSILYGIACAGVLLMVGKKIINLYPHFVGESEKWLIVVLGFAFTSIIILFLSNRTIQACIALFAFTFASSFWVLPLYRGLDFFQDSAIIKKIDAVSTPSDQWATTDTIQFLNFPVAAGRNQTSGSQLYPDLEYWKRNGFGKYENIYNRQARSIFITTKPDMDTMVIPGHPNQFFLKFECSEFVFNEVDYVMATEKISLPCVEALDTIRYPKRTFYIYRVQND